MTTIRPVPAYWKQSRAFKVKRKGSRPQPQVVGGAVSIKAGLFRSQAGRTKQHFASSEADLKSIRAFTDESIPESLSTASKADKPISSHPSNQKVPSRANSYPSVSRRTLDNATQRPTRRATIGSGSLTGEEIFAVYDDILTDPRAASEITFFMDYKRGLGCTYQNPIDLFITDSDVNTVPMLGAQKIRDCCSTASLDGLVTDLATLIGQANDLRRAAWIDDRTESPDPSRSHREYKNPMTASELYSAMRLKRSGDDSLPDANRRLIYIENLNRAYIFALAETAFQYQVHALRESIASHLSFNTRFSFSPPLDTRSFRLSMHMKYPVVLLSGSTLGRPAHLPYIDTDFANKQRSSSSNVQVACLYEARMTIEFCGQGYLKYTCWAFADTTHEGESITEKDASDFSYTDPVEGSTELHEDPIAAEFTLEANRPLLDVRNYALQLLTLHLKKLVTKWKDAVELFDDPFGNHIKELTRISNLGNRSEERREQQRVALCAAIQQNQDWRSLLDQLDRMLSDLIQTLENFSSPLGGLAFISRGDHSLRHSNQARHAYVMGALEDLTSLNDILCRRIQTCELFAKQLNVFLKVETSERNGETANVTMVTMQYITPIMVVIGMCSMNEGFMLFSPSKLGLLVATILVFASFSCLQHVVTRWNEHPQWWKKLFHWLTTQPNRLHMALRQRLGLWARPRDGGDGTMELGIPTDSTILPR